MPLRFGDGAPWDPDGAFAGGGVVVSGRPAPAPGWLGAVAVDVLDAPGCPAVPPESVDVVTWAGVVVDAAGVVVAVTSAGTRARCGGRVSGPWAGLGTCTPTASRASAATSWAGPGRASAAARLPVRVRTPTATAAATFTLV